MPTHSGSKHTKVKIFTKDEPYVEPKHFRAIWARVDDFKAVFGPVSKGIEKEVFALKYFIKKIPIKDRPKYITDMMKRDGYKYYTTDFSQYESHFTRELMLDCEFVLYEHMLANVEHKAKIMKMMKNTLTGINSCENRFFNVKCKARRMSGEMNTSLGNGFSNLMFLLFAKYEYPIEMTDPVVEGDDGLVGILGQLPPEHFLQLGLTVKMEVHDDLSTASFCGLVFDPEEQIIVTEPLYVLASTPWLQRKYNYATVSKLRGLLKSKALSICWQYYGCPIVYKYGLRLLALLADEEFVKPPYSYWEEFRFENAMKFYSEFGFPMVLPGPCTRRLMESKFGISAEAQLMIEKELDDMTLTQFNGPTAESLMPDVWGTMKDLYVRKYQQCTQRDTRDFTPLPLRKFEVRIKKF